MGVIRHADAGYERAIEVARERGVRVPMLDATEAPTSPARGQPVAARLGSTGSVGISRSERTGEKSTGRNAKQPPIAPTQIVAWSPIVRAEDAADDDPDRDRAPDDEPHRGVHPALHPLRA